MSGLFYVNGGLAMLIYERLKSCRKECKLTQQQVADLLGVDRSTYAYYELGVSVPSIENLVTLSTIFNVDFTWLTGADKPAENWNAPEGELAVLIQTKEKHMAELSKEERLIVALFRLAGKNKKSREFHDILFKAAMSENNEE